MENKDNNVKKSEQNVQPSTSTATEIPHFAPSADGGPKRIIKKFVAIDPNKIKKFGIENMIANALNKLKANQKTSATTILNTQHKKQTKPAIQSISSTRQEKNKTDDITIKTPTLNSDIKFLLNKKLKEKAEQKLRKEREKTQNLVRDEAINKIEEVRTINNSNNSAGKLVKSVECAVNKITSNNISKKSYDDNKTIIITDLGQKKKEKKVSSIDSNLKINAAATAIEELRLLDVQRRSNIKRVPSCTITAPPKPVDNVQVSENAINFDFSEMEIDHVPPVQKEDILFEKYIQINDVNKVVNELSINYDVVNENKSCSSSNDEFYGFTGKEIEEEQGNSRRLSDLIEKAECNEENKTIPSFSNLQTYLHQKKSFDTVADKKDSKAISSTKSELVDDIKTINNAEQEKIDEPKKKLPPIRKKAVPVSVLKLSKKGPVVSGKFIKNDSNNQKSSKSEIDLIIPNTTSTTATTSTTTETVIVNQTGEVDNNQSNILHSITDLTTDNNRTVVLKIINRDPHSGNIKFEVIDPLIKAENVEDVVKESSEVVSDSIKLLSNNEQKEDLTSAETTSNKIITSNENINNAVLEHQTNLEEDIKIERNYNDNISTTECDWQNDDIEDNDVDQLDRGEVVLGVITNLIKLEEQKFTMNKEIDNTKTLIVDEEPKSEKNTKFHNDNFSIKQKTYASMSTSYRNHSITNSNNTKKEVDNTKTFIVEKESKAEKNTEFYDDHSPIKQKRFASMSTSDRIRPCYNNNDNIKIINNAEPYEAVEDAVDFLLSLDSNAINNEPLSDDDSLLSDCDSIDFDVMDDILGFPQPHKIKQEIIQSNEIEEENYLSLKGYQKNFVAIPSLSPKNTINQQLHQTNYGKINNICNNDNDDDTDVESPDFEDLSYDNEQNINNESNKVIQQSDLLFDNLKQNTISYSINDNIEMPQQRKLNNNLKPIVLEDKILSEKERIDIIVLNSCDFLAQNTTTDWTNQSLLIPQQRQNDDNNIIYLDDDLPTKQEVEIVSETDLPTKNSNNDIVGQTIIVTDNETSFENVSCKSEIVTIDKNVEEENNDATTFKLGQVISMDLLKVEKNSANIVDDLNTTISINDNKEYTIKHNEKRLDLNLPSKSSESIVHESEDQQNKNEDLKTENKTELLNEQTNHNKIDSTSLSKAQNIQEESNNPPKKIMRKKIKPVPKIFSALKAKFNVDKKLTDKSKTLNKSNEVSSKTTKDTENSIPTINNNLDETIILDITTEIEKNVDKKIEDTEDITPEIEKNVDKNIEDTTISSINTEVEIISQNTSVENIIGPSISDVKVDDDKKSKEVLIGVTIPKTSKEINCSKGEVDSKSSAIETLSKDEKKFQVILDSKDKSEEHAKIPEISLVTKVSEDVSSTVKEVNVAQDLNINDQQESINVFEVDTNMKVLNPCDSLNVKEEKEEQGGLDVSKEEAITSLHSSEETSHTDATITNVQTVLPKLPTEKSSVSELENLEKIAQAENDDSNIVEQTNSNTESITNENMESTQGSVVHISKEINHIEIESNQEVITLLEVTTTPSSVPEIDDNSKSNKLLQNNLEQSVAKIVKPSSEIDNMKNEEDKISGSIVKEESKNLNISSKIVKEDKNEIKSIIGIVKSESVESNTTHVINKFVDDKQEYPINKTVTPAESEYCSENVSEKTALVECSENVSQKTAPVDCSENVSEKAALVDCSENVSQKTDPVYCDANSQNNKRPKDKSDVGLRSRRSKKSTCYLPKRKSQKEKLSSDVSSTNAAVNCEEDNNFVEPITVETNKNQTPAIIEDSLEKNSDSSTLKSRGRRTTKRKQEEDSTISTEASPLPRKRTRIDNSKLNDSSIQLQNQSESGKTRSGRKVKLTQRYLENFNEKKSKRSKKCSEETTETPLIVIYENEGNSTTESSLIEKNQQQLIILYENEKNEVNENVTVITTNMNNQINENDDDEIISPPKRNRKRKYVISDESDNDTATTTTVDSIVPPKDDTLKISKKVDVKEEPSSVKKLGRKPRKNDTDIKLHPRLLLVQNRNELNKEVELPENRPLKKGEVKCGLCKEILNQKLWKKHIGTHYGIGWKENVEPPVDIESYRSVYNAMINYFKNYKPHSVSCKFCGNVFKSGGGICYHLVICNASEEEKLDLMKNCEHCNKQISKLGYSLHLKKCKVITAEKEEINQETQEFAFNNSDRFKRKSLIRAEQKLKAVTKEVLELEQDSLIKTYLAPRVGMLKKWNHEIKSGKQGKCPGKNCDFSSSDLNELRYHYSNCDKVVWCGFICMQCKFLDSDKDIVRKHVKNVHGLTQSLKFADSGSEAEIGSESSESDVSDSLDNETEKKSKRKKGPRKEQEVRVKSLPVQNEKWRKIYPSHTANTFVQEGRNALKHFRSINYSSSPLFNYAVPSHIDVLPDFKFDIYKPYNDESMQYCYNTKEKYNIRVGSSAGDNFKTLGCFQVDHFKNETLMYIGGPVTALSWIPLPDNHNESEYLALSYKKDLNHYTLFGSKDKYKTLILICKIGLAENFQNDIDNLSILYGIPIDTGPVFDIQFLPSGGYAPEINRLGLMAVAKCETDINIYSLPLKAPQNCDIISDKFSIYDIAPSLILTLNIKDKWSNGIQLETQCLRILWSQSKGHNIFVAGYANGFVALWDISEDDNLNRFLENGKRIFLPYKYFCASSKPPTAIDLHYDSFGPRWLAYANQCRDFTIFDLQDLNTLSIMADDSQRHSVVINWPIYWETLIVGTTDDGNQGIGTLNAFSSQYILYRNRRAWKSTTGVVDITFNPWKNYCAFGLNNGDILFNLCYDWKHDVGSRSCCTQRYFMPMDMIRLDGQQMLQYKIQTKEKIPIDLYENDYKSKYAIVFYPVVQVRPEQYKDYCSTNRIPVFNLQKFMKINRIAYNSNKSGKQLVATGYENGFLRIHKTNF